MKITQKWAPFLASMLLCLSLNARNLIVNGNFEAGQVGPVIPGWISVVEGGSEGEWQVYNGTILPISGQIFLPPPEGNQAAVTDENGAASMILYQDVTLPVGNWTLQFTYYYNNPFGAFIIPSPDSLDYSPHPNQQFRVDIMSPTPVGGTFSLLPVDIFQNLISTPAGTPATPTAIYTTVLYDLSAFSGQTIRLRFAAVANEGILNLGIDAVSIIVPDIPIIVPPLANLAAKFIKNRFLTQTDLIVQLTWETAPVSGLAS